MENTSNETDPLLRMKRTHFWWWIQNVCMYWNNHMNSLILVLLLCLSFVLNRHVDVYTVYTTVGSTFTRTFGAHTYNYFWATNAFIYILRLCTLYISLSHCEHGAIQYDSEKTTTIRFQIQAVKLTIWDSKMALSVPKAPGVAQMLKDGARVSKIN